MTYTVSLDHFLSASELNQLRDDHLPSLRALNDRYTPHIDPFTQFPVTPIYIDHLRDSWRLSGSADRPPPEVAAAGLGFGFGLLLAVCTELRWAIATDNIDGAFVTMARKTERMALVSVPPFSYVRKKQDVESAQVFQDFFEQISPELVGFRKPPNWLLNSDA